MNILHSTILTILLTATPLFAWDPIGHMIVNQIAYESLTPPARTKIDTAMEAFNAKENADYEFVTAGCWMDDIRARTRDYNAWHYVNLPFTREGLPLPEEDAGPNVIQGADTAIAVLSEGKEHAAVPAVDAAVILSHLVGDMHQPLHTTSRNADAGGNRVILSNLKDPQSDLIFSRGGNLHFFWDSAYRRVHRDGKADVLFANKLYPRDKPLEGHKAALDLVRKEASEIMQEFPPSIMAVPGNPTQWALESHEIGYSFAYGELPDTGEATPVALEEPYVTKARTIARERLALAGYRLAATLNEIFGD